MEDSEKTKEQLISDLAKLRQQVVDLKTKHQKAEAGFKITESQFRTWLEHSPVCTKIVDLDFNLQYMSDAGVKGLKIDDVTEYYGKPFPLDFYPEVVRRQISKNLAHVKSSGETVSEEGPVVDIDGNVLWFHATYVPVNNDDGQIDYIIVVSVDINERKRLETHIRSTQRLETMGTLAGGIAHDFNNILTPIVGYTDMVQAELEPNGVSYNNLQEVLNGAHRAKDLVDQILLFSRKGDNISKPIDLLSLVNESVSLLRATIPSSINIVQNTDWVCDEVMADESQIHQVILNLCSNAAYAMKENGSGILTLTLDQVKTGDCSKKIHSELNDESYVRLSVADTGSGIDEKTIQHIFEPFFTTKSPGDGTGLGLSVAYGIVRSHKGDIQVESKPGKGTTFYIYLPIAAPGKFDDDIKPANDTQKSITGGNESILVVDDEKTITGMLKDMLGGLGYSIDTLNSSLVALEVIKQDPDKYDLLITDLTLPDLTGIELAKALRDEHLNCPIIIITGYGVESLTRSAMAELRISKVLKKPIIFRKIAEAIREAISYAAVK